MSVSEAASSISGSTINSSSRPSLWEWLVIESTRRDIGRSPEPVGQLLDRDERFPRENGDVLRRDRDERGVREGVGVFQPFQRDDARVVFGEVIPDIHVDFDDAPGAGGKRQQEDDGKQDRQPSGGP